MQFGYSRVTRSPQDQSLIEETLTQQGATKVIFETQETLEKSDLYQLIQQMKKNDVLIVSELKELGCSTRQLGDFCQRLEEKGLHLAVMKERFDTRQNRHWIEFIIQLSEMEATLVKERTLVGLQRARQQGKIGGRPKISPKTIQKIRTLYFEKQETIPVIAKKCQVSVGTCYKYISLKEE